MKTLFALALLLLSAHQLMSQVSFSVSTDKSIYYYNDPILVTMTARNSGSVPYQFYFCSGCRAECRIDTLDYLSGSGFGCTTVLTPDTIPANDSLVYGPSFFVLNSFTGAKIGAGLHAVLGSNICFPGWIWDTTWILVVPSVRLDVNQNWNMVSVPVQTGQDTAKTLFPSMIDEAFTFDGNGYQVTNRISSGGGYWMKFMGSEELNVDGSPLTSDTVDVVTGWNMIGSISAPVRVASISSIPPGITTSGFFGYSRRYFVSDTITPGKAYWVKSSENGKLILSSASKFSPNTIRIGLTSEQPPSPPNISSYGPVYLPRAYAVSEAYPNPFNPNTTIHFELPEESHVHLELLNVLGQFVLEILDEEREAGVYDVKVNAGELSSGVYFYRFVAGEFMQTKKMVLIK